MADQITWADKSNSETSPLPVTEKVSASDMNEIKSTVNTNAGETNTNTTSIGTNITNIATNTADIATNVVSIALKANLTDFDPVAETGTALDLLTKGSRQYGETTALSAATLTINSSENGGSCIVRHNHTAAPTITGATARNDFSTNYVASSDNFIVVWMFGATIYYQLI